MKLKVLLIMLLLAVQGAVMKAAAEETASYSLVVWTSDGGSVSYDFGEEPRVTHADGILTVTTTADAVEYPAEYVSRFTISKEDVAVGVDEVDGTQGEMSKRGDTLSFRSFPAGSSVSVYSISGALMTSGQVDADGNLVIFVGGYPSGAYIVKTASITYKIIKK